MRVKVKMVLNVVMLILLFLQMEYHFIGNLLHSWIGIILLILMFIHNILNWKWYARLCKGKYTPVRLLHIGINLLLLISSLGLLVSAIFLLPTVSAFLNIYVTMLGRKMHMMFTAWSFIFTSTHVGIYWNSIFDCIKKEIRNSINSYLITVRIVVLFISVYGIYAFVSRGFLQRMFLLSEYVFFNYEESIILFIADYIAIFCLFASTVYWIKRMVLEKKFLCDIRKRRN